ncbi:MBL fold metallo-hydrolase [Wenzhouxiangella sp. XN79A]|uniref:MBL fold metallo-hydrolase n=1 Tax=Wenzhouxiangella sp. XN79A TaxID=2724193 RepID=UPI00144AF44D|nr:MBL fold metallo-hydrolase [Wenzhouxiangella sp. XN79A]NKI36560.1 MBL fold metallo-hydrolase [Wenzhouxiangella sp. XN79A]
MFVEKIKSDGLAHLSWVIGGDGEAAVIDPRRDCEVYSDIAAANGCRITHVFETHRNEDLLSGARILAERTGAKVVHGPNAAGDVVYAETARDGDEFDIGSVRIRVLETPGHTDDSLSFAYYDTLFGDEAVGVFTGDTLFVGDVGRTDFYPDRKREVAGLLYDSLQKLLALGDQAVLHPAHGAGSVCGDAMADREVSTLGYERLNNPRLQIDDRETFIDEKVAEHHRQPPYFRHMEAGNLKGASAIVRPVRPAAMAVDSFEAAVDGRVVLDVRSASAYLGAHLPSSLAIPESMIASFAGWFLSPDDELLLVVEDADQAERAARSLARIGFDQVHGHLVPSLPDWAAAGHRFDRVPVIDTGEVKRRVEQDPPNWVLLDVRDDNELESGRVPGSVHAYVGELPERLETLDRDRDYTVMCGSGSRATIAASLLLRNGFENVDLYLGSFSAWAGRGLETAQ